ncbi:MAG: serine/threonine protein kinase [Actinomycetia bacterium]|nr:serine/threonine protein kinase [Actinomycetes bacterium]
MTDEPTNQGVAEGITLVGAGTVIAGRYHLESLLGSGGMAQVWEASDQTLGRRVAVKVLHPHLAGDDTFVRRFRQEAIAAARLTHPGIVGVYDTCSDGTYKAIVMELLDARTLREVLDERGTLDAESVRRIGLRLLDALEAAHQAGLVHRDIKPSNILLCTDGRVKIADFGIAKAEDHTELTRDGSLMGTASYLAPEQLEGESVDGRSDLYALGIVLYECLVGRIPFQGDSGAAVALARLHTDPVDPRRYRADVPAALAATIMSALERVPADRFADAAEFRADLLFLTDETHPQPVPAPASSAPEAPAAPAQPQGFGRSERRWLLPALGVALVGTALVVAGLLLSQGTQSRVTPPSTLPPELAGAAFSEVSTFDPSGTGQPGENDSLAPLIIDGDPATLWRTEQYERSDFFDGKDGVGLILELATTSTLDRLDIAGSTNGWSGEVHLLRDDEGPDPDSPPSATLTDVRAPLSVALGGERADSVLIWITDLGDGDGSHRVEISEVSATGTAVG